MLDNYNEFSRVLEGALNGRMVDQARIRDAAIQETAATATMFFKAASPAFSALVEKSEEDAKWKLMAKPHVMTGLKPEQLMFWGETNALSTAQGNGGHDPLAKGMPVVPEATPFPELAYSYTSTFVTIGKRGVTVRFPIEALINGEWNVLREFPSVAAKKVAETNLAVHLATFASGGNLRADVFSEGNGTTLLPFSNTEVVGSAVPKNSPLTRDALLAAVAQAQRARKFRGQNVAQATEFVLVVPQSLRSQAEAILNTTRATLKVGNTEVERIFGWSHIKLLTDPIWDTLAGSKAWFIAPLGGEVNGKEVLAHTTLQSHPKPDLRLENLAGTTLSGQGLKPQEGSFSDDTVAARIRHFVGSSLLGVDGIVGSTGAGS